ncbi:RNA polymerase sigma-70 factor (ECF subfamily) [Erythromicrobium ramosum]|uniref:RNA polymerase sigma-70 factor (ECF subfamily) n=1 Tax=Erythrobacter ramosus TaxID=35811 RepID=A0A6I4UH89_9SPHN|nr:sigma-70 family RNA polymerase sigma factor [Erythrobacter ramosus]MBB3776430.1 RNA polymerase sigma-70 factor (ECF subfamily) [Erythrobacter ramosus]MXP38491.1 sigma-70 family RNA polymerase sigma factor [Erythrobacter ramosus]
MNASSEPSTSAPRTAGPGDDAALAARLAARDPAALREVIACHAAALHRACYRMTADAHEAEDIVQEACLRLWDQAPKIAARHPIGNQAAATLRLGGWLQRVVTNLAIDRLRRTRRLSDGEVPDSADEAPLADTLIEAGERDGTARALIMALPERQRAAIVLTYYEELSNADAAEAMEMNIKAFESLLHRARAALRQAWTAQGDAP